MKYTKSSDTSATWRRDTDQRRPAAINGEEMKETPAFAKASADKEGIEGIEERRQDPAGTAAG